MKARTFLISPFARAFFCCACLVMLCLFVTSCGNSENEGNPTVVITSITPNEGPASTIVTLTGNGFSAIASENVVTLNDKSCAVLEATTTELKITIPPEAGSGKIQVNVKGKSGETTLFTFIEEPEGPAVSTLAGSVLGYVDATGTNAQFKDPAFLVIDANNNLFVSEPANSTIRKITPAGVVTTFAGTANHSDSDEENYVGTNAHFANPEGLAFDASGNLYVADYDHNKIRKITSEGVVSTFVGGPNSGYADGTGSAVQFTHPSGLAFDASGNLFVSEEGNHKIRKITPAGVVSTFAGDAAGFSNGTGTNAQFHLPTGLAFDASGNLFVADFSNHMIRKITPSGVVSTYSGNLEGSNDGPIAFASFKYPYHLAFDASGNLFVTEASNSKIRKITPEGIVSTFIGGEPGFTDGVGSAVKFWLPRGLAFDTSGNLFVSDNGNNKIRKVHKN